MNIKEKIKQFKEQRRLLVDAQKKLVVDAINRKWTAEEVELYNMQYNIVPSAATIISFIVSSTPVVNTFCASLPNILSDTNSKISHAPATINEIPNINSILNIMDFLSYFLKITNR